MSKSTKIHERRKVHEEEMDSDTDSNSDNQILQYDTENAAERLFNNPESELENISQWCKSILSYAENKLSNFQAQKGPIAKKLDEIEKLTDEVTTLNDDILKQEFDRKVEENRNKMLMEVLYKLQQDFRNVKTEIDELAQEFPQLELERDAKIEQFKDTFNAYKYASKYYTKYLGLYVDIEDMEKFVAKIYYFSQNGPNKEYFITLQKSDDQWSLINASSQIQKDKFRDLQKKLEIDHDIAFVVCTARKIFMDFRNKN